MRRTLLFVALFALAALIVAANAASMPRSDRPIYVPAHFEWEPRRAAPRDLPAGVQDLRASGAASRRWRPA